MGCAPSKSNVPPGRRKDGTSEDDARSVDTARLRITVQNEEGKVMYNGVEHERLPTAVRLNEEPAFTVLGVGAGANMTGPDRDLRKHMEERKKEIRLHQDKLNSSINIPIVDKEREVLETGSWLKEQKDLRQRYSPLPPIQDGKKVKSKAMAFTV